MKRLAASSALASALALPAAALDLGFDPQVDLFLDRDMFGLDMTGTHDGELVVPTGSEEAPQSAFIGEPVHFADGQTRLGTVDTVFAREDGARWVVVTLADDVEVAMVDAIYVAVPEGATADGAIRLNLTEAELIGMAANWAD